MVSNIQALLVLKINKLRKINLILKWKIFKSLTTFRKEIFQN